MVQKAWVGAFTGTDGEFFCQFAGAMMDSVYIVRVFNRPSPNWTAGQIPSSAGTCYGDAPSYRMVIPVDSYFLPNFYTDTPVSGNPPPAAPSAPAATAVSSGQITITWRDNSNNEDGFKLDRRQSGTSVWVTLTAAANATSLNDTSVAPETKYYYKILAYNAAGNSAYTAVVDATTPAAATAPGRPTNLKAEAVSASEIKLTWTDTSNNEDGFKIRRSADGSDFDTLTPIFVGANVTTCTDAGLPADTTYWYKIYSYNTVGDSGYTAAVSAKTQSGGTGGVVDVRVAASSDDAEENLATGAVSLNSSDLELIHESYGTGQDQAVGIRFANVAVPPGATVTKAYLQFKADETGSAATSLTIRGQDADNAGTFTSAAGNITSRSATTASVAWSPAAWNTVGEAGAAQRTPDIAAVVQEIVDRAGWANGNALAILITGTGKRTAEAYEGDNAGAPLLHIEYGTEGPAPDTVEVRIATGNDDAEENVGTGATYLDSSDLELILEGTATEQIVGMRFNGVAIPQGATIVNAYIQFKVDEVTTASTALQVQGQAADNAAAFTAAANNISARARTAASVAWNPPAWSSVGAAGANQRTPDISAVVQEVVGRSGWASGNSLVLLVTGSGKRTAESYDGDSAGAPLLHVEYTTQGAQVAEARVAAGSDDAEENLGTGAVYLDSSDLELILEGTATEQIVGMRFRSIGVPNNATILNAYVQFKADEIGTSSTALRIQGQATDDAAAFTTAAGNISARPRTAASVAWNPPAWSTVGQAGAAQRTPDLATVVQEIVSRAGWAAGNDMVVIVTGSGKRTAEAYEGDSAGAALLHVEYSTSGPPPPPPPSAFTAYNDMAWFSGQTQNKITTYTIPSGGANSGPLVDHASGTTLAATVTITGGGGVYESQGAHPASGTDAYSVFNGIVDGKGTASYGTEDLVMTFAGLDPALVYELVLYCDRNGASYVGTSSRDHVGTISGATAFANASTAGTLVSTTAAPNDTTKYNAGYNNRNGYVTRYANINPGPDGAFTLTVKRDSALRYYTYANAFMLKGAEPAPSTGFTAYNDMAWFSGQTQNKITTYTIPSGGANSGTLVDYASGAALAASVTITGGSGVYEAQGAHPASGTDAYSVFNGIVDGKGTASYGTEDLIMAFAGLDPALRYELVVYSDRNSTSYTGANSRYHVGILSGAASFANASSSGAVRSTTAATDDTTTYNAGYNNRNGYVTRYANIDPGADGAFTLTVKRDSLQKYYSYANAFMLKATAAGGGGGGGPTAASAAASSAPDADDDGDGLPDAWESSFLGNLAALANGDADGDGASNLEEFIAGTDPGLDASCFELTIELVSGEIVVSFNALEIVEEWYQGAGRWYVLESKPASGEGDWTPVPGFNAVLGAGQLVTHFIEGIDADEPQVYRARIWLGQD
ncbi:MAG: fibronectin type III domain-containing protein [Kiritimatiellae bacterium]|nr:fibronectin type III domain-containing protein [Kiritimatiellia bacterium]